MLADSSIHMKRLGRRLTLTMISAFVVLYGVFFVGGEALGQDLIGATEGTQPAGDANEPGVTASTSPAESASERTPEA